MCVCVCVRVRARVCVYVFVHVHVLVLFIQRTEVGMHAGNYKMDVYYSIVIWLCIDGEINVRTLE